MLVRWVFIVSAIALSGFPLAVSAASPKTSPGPTLTSPGPTLTRLAPQQEAADRIRTVIDDRHTIALPGNTHPFARPAFAIGRVAPESRLEKMILVLESSPQQQRLLDAFTANLYNPASAQYHHWLTPESFARLYGVSAGDLERISLWLISSGFSVDEVPASHRLIVFSGTAAQVENAFHTEMLTYKVGGRLHLANSSDPRIPAALAGVVGGISTLHDFRSSAMHAKVEPVDAERAKNGLQYNASPEHNADPDSSAGSEYNARPAYNVGAQHFLAPSDFATIYDLDPLYATAIDGTGQTIAIAARSNVKLTDIATFRSTLGLPANVPVVTLAGANPGTSDSEDEVEADLDVEWAGAVARNATVNLVAAASTATTDGIDIAAQYIVNNNLAPVMSTSYGSCEATMGSTERSFYNALWQQAAAQGITTLVASGDSGGAACDSAASTIAELGRAVNGLCSTPYNVCVGGTQFADAGDPGLYWSSTVNPTTYASVLSYIPEAVWNESADVTGGQGLYATGGGASAYIAKPVWQSGTGVPADGRRDVPDVAFTAADHDGYLIYSEGALAAVGGTSAATPSFAGMLALVNQSLDSQSAGTRIGNPNPTLYSLAAQHPRAFHDVTSGNNSVPGVTGYSAGAGYDLVTGLGSVDAAQLVSLWPGSIATKVNPPTIRLSISAASLSVVAGSSLVAQLTVSASNGFNADVVLSASGLPAGMETNLQPTVVGPNGIAVIAITTSTTLQAGNYSLAITATGGGVTTTVPLVINVTPRPYLAVTTTQASLTLRRGGSAKLQLATSAIAGFNAPVSLHINGLPRGVTATVSSATIAAPGNGTATITVSAGAGAVHGKRNLILTTVGGGETEMYLVPLTVY